MIKRAFISFLLIFTTLVQADLCQEFHDDIPVLAQGRVKPYFVLAKESVKFLTGKAKYNHESQGLTFCRLLLSGKNKTDFNIPILIEHIDTKKLMGIPKSAHSLAASELLSKKDLIRSEIMKLKETSAYKKDLNKLFARLNLYERIKNGQALKYYSGNQEGEPKGWDDVSTLNHKTDQILLEELKSSKQRYIEAINDDYLLELTYVKLHLFGYALALALLGVFLTVLLKSLTWPLITTFVLITTETIAMIMRIYISGRAPITNMYETVMFSGHGALIIALIILYFKREKIFLLAGLSYNMLCLFMMIFANGMLDASISPLVPVLRDNFWLSTHVTTIILSYAALALSWMVANITLFKMRFKNIDPKEYRFYQGLIYTCIKVGVVLLASGIILGGVWADYSWGRFWGWDPKETWSLIVLLFYMILLHGKSSSWINTHRFVLLSAAGFMSVMMAWFGVNYILAAGLHSYGFSEGGAVFLGSFFFIQTLYIIICAKAK